MRDLFFYRRDLFIGSVAAAILGPLSWFQLFAWLKAHLERGGSWRALAIFAAVVTIYSVVRAAVDVASDLVEWNRGLHLFSASLDVGSLESTKISSGFSRFVEVEAIVVGLGVIFSFAALTFFGHAIEGLNDLEMFCAMMNPVGGVILATRNQTGLYPFRFCMRGRNS